MGAVYRRDGSRFLWLKYVDAAGEEKRQSSETTDKALARALLDEIERQEREKAKPGPRLTVRKFYDDTWVGLRRVRKPFAWKGDTYKMALHFLPKFGRMSLSDLGNDQGELLLLDWLTELRAHLSKRDGTPLAPRTVRNVASIVRVFFADAFERRAETKMTRNPSSCWDADRHFPAIEDKEHGWRMHAGFTLEQVVVLTTDERIPEDRRALYSLRFLGGPRPGEAANARWRDLDRSKKPLWRLTLEQSFNSPMRQEKSTKTLATLTFPIHPVVRKLLLAWEAEGWEKFMGRPPTPADFLFPREDGKQRLVSGTYKQFLVDLAAVGLPPQRQYESRSTFRNLAMSAGATEFHLNLITHPKPKKASDFYTRLEMQWPKMCEAVLAIDPAAWENTPAAVTRNEVTVGVTGKGTTNDKPPTTLTIVGGELEREKGFEPSTLALARRCSTAELFPQVLERGASL